MFARSESILILSIFLNIFIDFGTSGPLNKFHFNGRITGGDHAPAGSFPYQVSLRDNFNIHFCGGALISERWTISSANCIYGRQASGILIVVGADTLRDGSVYTCDNATIHDEYDAQTSKNDIAVLKAYRDIAFSEYVQPIKYYMGTAGCNLNGVITGWGGGGSSSEYLQFLNMTLITHVGCEALLERYFSEKEILAESICAIGTVNNNSSSVCYGDSGTPLATTDSRILLGVLSYGPCAQSVPGVFTQISHFIKWIIIKTGVVGVTNL